jgi:branched-chain amino acid transport system substrate-binding protein
LAAGVDAILGAAASGVSLNVIDKITKENCQVHFSPANTSPEFTDYDDGDLYFRTAPSDVLQGRILSDLIVEDGHTTVALLARQDSYGEGLLQFTKEPLEEQGAEVVVERVYDPEAQTFSAEVDEVISADPDALVMIGFAESSTSSTTCSSRGSRPTRRASTWSTATSVTRSARSSAIPVRWSGSRARCRAPSSPRSSGAGCSRSIRHCRTSATGPRPTTPWSSWRWRPRWPAATTRRRSPPTSTASPARAPSARPSRCKQLVADGEDIDYNGPPGPQEFSQPGEPTAATFAVMSYGDDNQIVDSATEFREASF